MLNVLLWLPLGFGLLALLLPGAARWIGSLGAAGALGLTIALIADFETGAGLQHVVSETWIPDLGIRYELAVDGVNLFLVALTAIAWLGATLFSALRAPERAGLYFLMLGLAETATLGAFLAQDLILFVLFFDLMLIPFYFLFGAWGSDAKGGPTAIAATTKMIIYTLVGSLLMLAAAIATGVLAADGEAVTFSLPALADNVIAESSQHWIFWFFAIAFLVKMPALLVHGWMPDAYRVAPLPVLALLSGVLSKVAAYGFIRIVLPLYPDATALFAETMMIIATASILYGTALAFTHTNIRLIAGFSSVAQMGFITLGIFALRGDGADGAVLQMVNHGLVVVPLLIIVAMLAERAGSEDLRAMGGLAKRAPYLAVLFLIVTMATLAIPGSANFIGEFFILNGAFQSKIAIAIVASSGVAGAAFYALRLYQRTMHNRLPEGADSREVSLGEGFVLTGFVACIVALALYPGFVLDRTEPDVNAQLEAVAPSSPLEVESVAAASRPVQNDSGLKPLDP